MTNNDMTRKYKKEKTFIDMKSETYSTFSQYCGYAFKKLSVLPGGEGVEGGNKICMFNQLNNLSSRQNTEDFNYFKKREKK